MKKTLLAIILLLATSSLGWAGACSSAPLSSYITAGFSCTETVGVDTLTFSGFRYSGTLPVPGVGVTVLANGFGFSPLSGPWSVSSNQILDATVIYTVTGDLDTITLDLESFSRANAGAVQGIENIAAGRTFLGSLTLKDNAKVDNCQSASQCFATLALPEIGGPFTIEKDLTLSADGPKSSASVGVLSNGFNVIPEPGSILLFGSGLLAMAAYVRRRLRNHL